jgi:hypothetical protein
MSQSVPKRKKKQTQPGASGNQGEGNRKADRRYREAATEFAESPRAEQAAEEARRSVEEGEQREDRGD